MVKIFAITTTTENLIANVNGTAKASVIFTVTNNSAKPIRGIATTQALERTEASWLSLDGAAEKDFPAGETQQFTVIFDKPLQPLTEGQTEPEEKYPYRLIVASAVRPDEDFDEGPLVTIYKPERKSLVKKAGIPWWVFLIIGVVVLAIVGVVLFFLLSGKAKKAVPDVTGKPTNIQEAKRTLQEAGFTVGDPTEILAPDKQVNIVLDQDPDAGVEAVEGSEVKLTVTQKVTVPTTLKGKCFVDAFNILAKADLAVNDFEGNAQDIGNCTTKVQDTVPTEKTVVAKGSQVTLRFPCVPTTIKPCRKGSVTDLPTKTKPGVTDGTTKLKPGISEGTTQMKENPAKLKP
ncbi:MAG TPA: PASTA domain-containing protein [Pyrinomonadaceae bacterium]|jgi:hypothetical protein|nr:PASTA domain-containing protein [Pyrinomonadaceae bacterium]